MTTPDRESGVARDPKLELRQMFGVPVLHLGEKRVDYMTESEREVFEAEARRRYNGYPNIYARLNDAEARAIRAEGALPREWTTETIQGAPDGRYHYEIAGVEWSQNSHQKDRILMHGYARFYGPIPTPALLETGK